MRDSPALGISRVRDLIYLLRGIFSIMEDGTFIYGSQRSGIKIIAGWSRLV
jgi:hypothetical protein